MVFIGVIVWDDRFWRIILNQALCATNFGAAFSLIGVHLGFIIFGLSDNLQYSEARLCTIHRHTYIIHISSAAMHVSLLYKVTNDTTKLRMSNPFPFQCYCDIIHHWHTQFLIQENVLESSQVLQIKGSTQRIRSAWKWYCWIDPCKVIRPTCFHESLKF